MKVDHCIILSAGFGTRMKSIGKRLPKPLWPIYEKTILELQIDYARMLGAKNIYVNLHYHFNQVLNYFHKRPEYEDVNFLIEDDILDIGGAVHNLASQKEIEYKGNLMILNGDQFVDFDLKQTLEAIESLNNYKSVLMAVKVDSRFGHSETVVNDKFEMIKIIPNSEIKNQKMMFTYSGMAFVSLEKLKPSKGASSLYDTVVTYKEDPIKMIEIKNYKYWDFGTLDRYWNSMFEIMDFASEQKSEFINFLINNGAFDLSKFKAENKSYNSSDDAINLSDSSTELAKGQILMSEKEGVLEEDSKGVLYKDLFEPVNFIQEDLLP